jgi:hypothetical protein
MGNTGVCARERERLGQRTLSEVHSCQGPGEKELTLEQVSNAMTPCLSIIVSAT